MLFIFELYQQYWSSCLVYIGEISGCYISRITQDLEFIFRVPIRNTMIKAVKIKKTYKI
jgi:hypothetical protein